MTLSARAVVDIISPPFGAFDAVSGDAQVWRAKTTDPPKTAVAYTDLVFAVAEGCSNPVLSPDRTKILFQTLSGSSGFYEIWVVDNVPGSTPTLLLADPANYWFSPFWHPDSDRFVCVHGDAGDFAGDLVLTSVSAPGTQTVLKTQDGTDQPLRPQISPDGAKVAYWWDQITGTGLELRVMDIDGSDDTLLHAAATGSYRFMGPQFGWSHDSQLIAFDDGVTSGPGPGLFVIAPDGTGEVQINSTGVAAGTGRISHLCFPPDDSYVVFASNLGSGYAEAIRAELDGSDTVSLNGTVGARGTLSVFYNHLVFEGRIWFIESDLETVSYMALDGSGYTQALDIDDESLMFALGGGDGFYFN